LKEVLEIPKYIGSIPDESFIIMLLLMADKICQEKKEKIFNFFFLHNHNPVISLFKLKAKKFASKSLLIVSIIPRLDRVL